MNLHKWIPIIEQVVIIPVYTYYQNHSLHRQKPANSIVGNFLKSYDASPSFLQRVDINRNCVVPNAIMYLDTTEHKKLNCNLHFVPILEQIAKRAKSEIDYMCISNKCSICKYCIK